MASSSRFNIRCKTQNGSFTLNNVSSATTILELKTSLSKKMNSSPARIKILCGYPPKLLLDDADSSSLKEVNIHSGETIIVEMKNDLEMAVAASRSLAANANAACSATANAAAAYSAANAAASDSVAANAAALDSLAANAAALDSLAANAAANYVKGKQEEIQVENLSSTTYMEGMAYGIESDQGIMMRHVVPSNNSCLFASVYFVLSNGELSHGKSCDLRKLISRVVKENPERYTTAFLGMPNRAYCEWIENVNHWGGAIELAILSEHFRLEICAVDAISLTMHRFGENCNYTNRIFLIYDGIHYDPLVLELDSANSIQTIFPINDYRPIEMAMEIAREAQSSRQFTDVANFTLRCLGCNARLRGDKEARQHALTTGHVNFGEISQ